MMQLQWHTGMRPGEARTMKTGEIETGPKIWLYRPSEFKTEHHDEDAERVIAIGPKGQEVLRSWLRTGLDEYLFQPREAEAARLAERRQAVDYERPPCHEPRRRRKRRPRTPPGDHYTKDTYGRAIARACAKAFGPPAEILAEVDDAKRAEMVKAWRDAHRFTPHQIRHSFGTRARKEFGLDASRAAMGHLDANVTLDYAELDKTKATMVARRIG